MKKYPLFLFVLIVFNSCHSQSAQHIDTSLTVIPGKNISIPSNVPGLAIVEAHLSLFPGNDNHLLVAAMVITSKDNPYESARLTSFVSVDGGNSWKQTDHDYWGYDPWTAILPNGKTLMTWLGRPGKFSEPMIIQVFQSDDGGATWKTGTQTIEGEYDGTKMAMDLKTNTIVFTAATFSSGMRVNLYFNKSINGEKFAAPTTVDCKGEMHAFTQPVILSDGSIVVSYAGEKGNIWSRVSEDGGKTFLHPYPITKPKGHGLGYMQMAAGANDRLYFVQASGDIKNPGGIWINFSEDKGKTWSKDIRVDLFAGNPKSHAMVPSLAVNKNGVIGISWIDRQNGDGTDIYFAASADGGRSFSRPVRISNKSANARTAANGDVANKFPGGGHYCAIATKSNGSFQLIWSDSRTGIFQLQTCNVIVK